MVAAVVVVVVGEALVMDGMPRAEAKAWDSNEGPACRGSGPAPRGFLLLASPGLASPRGTCVGAGTGVGTGMGMGTLSVEEGVGRQPANEADVGEEGWDSTLVGGLAGRDVVVGVVGVVTEVGV